MLQRAAGESKKVKPMAGSPGRAISTLQGHRGVLTCTARSLGTPPAMEPPWVPFDHETQGAALNEKSHKETGRKRNFRLNSPTEVCKCPWLVRGKRQRLKELTNMTLEHKKIWANSEYFSVRSPETGPPNSWPRKKSTV